MPGYGYLGGSIEGLIKNCDEKGLFGLSCKMQRGQELRISSGPFAELVGTFERMEGEDAVHLLLDIMGRSISVQARCEVLLPAA